MIESILEPDSPDETALQAIVDCALEVGLRADSCGMLVRRGRGRLEPTAATGASARTLLEQEIELGDGPAIDVAAGSEQFVISDADGDTRWPAWRTAARSAGIGSVLAVPLASEGEVLGALVWYAAPRGAFDTGALDTAKAFADVASAAAATSKAVVGLRHAMRSRHVIGIAQGILMQRYGMGEETAFEVLRRYSNQDNVKLRDLAQRVIAERALPDRDTAPE